MNKQKRDNAIFWALLIACCAALAAYAVLGVVDGQAQAEESSGASAPPTLPVSDEQALQQEHRSHSVEAVEAGKVDKQGEPIDQPESEQEAAEGEEYDEAEFEPVYEYYGAYTGYTGGSTATTTHDLLNGQGRAYDENGTSYTYYGDVYGHLDIPGENVDADGVIHDGDGYIVVAADGYEQGAVIDTPYGQAKNYDRGSGAGNIDIYTNRG